MSDSKTRLVKVRLQGDEEDVEALRKILLEKCPELVLGKARKGTNPKYNNNQKWASYGNFIFNLIRKRRSN
jgi:hypothetical protein